MRIGSPAIRSGPDWRWRIPGSRDALSKRSRKQLFGALVSKAVKAAIALAPGPREIYWGYKLAEYMAKHPEVVKAGISCIRRQDCEALKSILGSGIERAASLGQSFLLEWILNEAVPGADTSLVKNIVPALTDKLTGSEVKLVKREIWKDKSRDNKKRVSRPARNSKWPVYNKPVRFV